MAFNLYQYQKTASNLPNGQTTINLPNGQGMGDGVQLTNNEGGSMQGGGTDAKQLKDVIGDILYEFSYGDGDPEKIKDAATEAINADIPPEFAGKDDLVRMVAALGRRASEDPSKISTNPATGEKEQSLEELASSIANIAGWDVENLIQESEQRKSQPENPETIGTMNGVPAVRTSAKRTPVETTREEEFKEEEKEDPAKKRKKGNPFKVLLGLVGKMSSHGMGRREIVRKITKQEGNKWKPETIEKAVKVVMDAAKKKHRKESMSEKFNLYKYSQKKNVSNDENIKDFENRKSIYDIPRDMKLMSTMELISRLAYLSGASIFEFGAYNENNPGNKQMNSSQFVKDLKAVKAELANRNYNDEQINILSKTVQGVQTED